MDGQPADTDHSFRQQYLFAFAPQGEIVQHVRTEAVESERERLPAILAAWSRLQGQVATLIRRETADVGGVPIDPLPTEIQGQVDGYAEDPLFQKTIWKLPIRFGVVEIDRLIAAQRMVNLDYIDHLVAAYPARPSMAQLAEICLSLRRPMEPVQHLEIAPNTHVFTSPNSDLRFLGSYIRPLQSQDTAWAEGGGLPAAVLVSFVGYGASPINVIEAGGRVVLNNGFHRVFALRTMGVRHIPVVVQIARNPALEFPPTVVHLPREYILGAPRPVLMRDFLVPAFSVELRIRRRLKMVLVNSSASQHEVPS